jgi:nicotinate-nucleotide pyrophosphorylase (carboxylating)
MIFFASILQSYKNFIAITNPIEQQQFIYICTMLYHKLNYDDILEKLIRDALKEDIGIGDLSTLSTIDAHAMGKAQLKIKEDGVLAGIEVAKKIFQMLEPTANLEIVMHDGDDMHYGDIAFRVDAHVHTILKAERLVLNCMQRMSGIATLTRKYADLLQGYHTKILDTRKTTPNFRLLEKQAVRIGGGTNHRFGLYDMIMLKDNHIDYCGGIKNAINHVTAFVRREGLIIDVEMEARSAKDVQEIVDFGKGIVTRIMLDNFTPTAIADVLPIINGAFETEASGGINLSNIVAFASTGVDYVSVGALIHQARSLDLSLKAMSV